MLKKAYKKKSKNTTHFHNSSQNKSYYSGTSLWFIYEYSIFEPTLRFRNFFPYSYAIWKSLKAPK